MKLRITLLLLVFLLLLAACGTDTPQVTEAPTVPTENNETVQGENSSTLQPLVLEIPAEERCAITGNGKFAETENGYYMIRTEYLFYADKSDLSNWVLVCTKPDCSHPLTGCPGSLNSPVGFWLEDDSIYYLSNYLVGQELDAHYFIKMGLDDFSPQTVYADPALNWPATGIGGYSECGNGDSLCRVLSYIQEDGSWGCDIVVVDQQKTMTLFTTEYPPEVVQYDPKPIPYNVGYSVRGDLIIASQFSLDETPDANAVDWAKYEYVYFYQIYNDTIREIKLHEGCDLYGAYISGDSLWHYHMNDGFYYMDLSTGEEVKIADAAYENAYGHCVDGKHMVECSMSVPGYSRDSVEAKMRYFDGETWHELELPEYWNAQYKFRVLAGASDRIVFTVDDAERSYDCQQEFGYIMLGGDTLTICDKHLKREPFA